MQYDTIFPQVDSSDSFYILSQENRTNSTTSVPCFPKYTQIYITVLYIFIFIVGVAGNLLVMIVIVKTKYLRNSTNIFIFNLATGDAFYIIAMVTVEMINMYIEQPGAATLVIDCNILTYLREVSLDAAMMFIVAISVDRCFAVWRPLLATSKMTCKRGIYTSIAIWIATAIIESYKLYLVSPGVPKCSGNEDFLQRLQPYCHLKEGYASCVVMSNIIFYFIPLILLIVLYSLVIKKLITTSPILNSAFEEAILNERKRGVYIVGVIVVLYVILEFPMRFIIIYKYSPGTDSGSEVIVNATMVATVLVVLNSAVNPFVYNFMSKRFRKAFVDLVGWSRWSHFVSKRTSQNSMQKFNGF